MTTESILAAIDPDETIATLQQLVQASSDYPPGDTRQVVEVCTQKLAAEGLDFEVLAPEEHVPSLIATLPGQGTGPTLVMHSHLDTVPAYDHEDWTRDPWSGDLSNGRVYGRGTVDDKGCAAAQLMAFLALARAGVSLSGDLVLALVADEESGGDKGTRWLREEGHLKTDLLIVGEATDNHVAYTERVACGIDITLHGKATHGAIPWKGQSAITAAAYAIAALNEELIPRLTARARPGLPPPTLNFGTVRGGRQWNVVPAKCVIETDRRLDVGETRDAAMDEIREVLDGLADKIEGFSYDLFTQGDVAPNINTDPSAELVQVMHRALEEVSEESRPLTGYLHTSDGRWFAGDGIPIVIFGPGAPEQAHSTNEFVEAAQVVEATQVYALTAGRMLTKT